MSLAPELLPAGFEENRRTYRWIIRMSMYRFVRAKGIRTARHAEHVALLWVERWATRHGETILDIRYGYHRDPLGEYDSLRIVATVKGAA